MVRDHALKRLTLAALMIVLVLGLAACYKDAGENVQPTSYRVELSDLTPTQTVLAPSPTVPLPTAGPTTTRTLVPTTTPADLLQTPDDLGAAPTEEVLPAGDATRAPALPPSFTPPAGAAVQAESLIVTPGLSDIQPSNTPRPTIDPTLMPTPTLLPGEENPCIHVVQPNDTLYGIARDLEVELDALVAENLDVLGGQSTYLQIGWQLHIPGCVEEGAEGTPQAESTEQAAPAAVGGASATPRATLTPTSQSGPTTHVVQQGETIYAIARQYGVSPQAIIDANGLANPNRISPGDTLTIPGP